MSLDRERGEVLEGLPEGINAHGYIVIDPRVVANLTQYRVEYIPPSTKFRSRKTKMASRPVFDDAVAHAIEAFRAAGALFPVRFDEDDVLVQAYPASLKIAIIFQRNIAGITHHSTRYYDCPRPVMQALIETVRKH